MCGFCCYFNFDTSDNVYPNLDLDTALEYIHHRGPDSRGKYVSPDGRCALGHVRLSILDLAGGQQPLSNPSGKIQSVVNGELYDFERIRGELEGQGHFFKTKSDSEIALHLYEEYGLSFLDHLRGEFAAVIYDTERNHIIAARDRYGIKPLYYTVSQGTLLIASEIKSFIPLGWKPEWDVDSVLNNGTFFDNRTCFKGVYKVPPAHYLLATGSGSMEIRPYWDADYPDKNVEDPRSVDEMVQGVRDRLVEAVRHRLRADVPIGVYLSGGIDSSCIAGIASKLLKENNPDARMRAFSISFAGSEKYDEGEIAERTAKFCDVDFHKLSLTEDDLLSSFEESVWHVEQPQFNLNSVGKFLLSEFARDQGYKVVLTGEGSDEHFAGYSFFHGDYLLEPDHSSPHGFGTLSEADREIRLSTFGKNAEFAKYSENLINMEKTEKLDKTRKMVNNIKTHMLVGTALSMPSEFYHQAAITECGQPNAPLAMAEAVSGVARAKANSKWHPLHTALYLEGRTFLGNYLCNNLGDRCEMAHSIEARTPFMDHVLCEYVNGLPPSLKIKAEEDGTLNEKWVLKEAVKPFITEELYKRTKHPYIAPSSKGQNPKTVELVNRLISREKIDRLGWADTEKILEFKDTFLKTNDAGLFKDILFIMSFVILSERFNVATWEAPLTVAAAR
ncbi:asparagine synthase [Mycotypha africana]|uniref:asparagine synthase n=1 Tax=Mycotypha africana TaxID=64632 RepID=UPI0023010199|nr:asparagine synthase [Mycotypha africana]KAI8977412.1 asparagine synthase [Mycotypha africana]